MKVLMNLQTESAGFKNILLMHRHAHKKSKIASELPSVLTTKIRPHRRNFYAKFLKCDAFEMSADFRRATEKKL